MKAEDPDNIYINDVVVQIVIPFLKKTWPMLDFNWNQELQSLTYLDYEREVLPLLKETTKTFLKNYHLTILWTNDGKIFGSNRTSHSMFIFSYNTVISYF